ncbi:MAG: apolipoprotein N-acyltransferase [Elusimicrobia bacterium]|nr:apolipoprotein N-acyltransferase [Elusimicrobiota bacterium]
MPRGGLGRLTFAALGAGLLALALPPLGFWPLGWVGLAPLFWACGRSRPGAAAAAGGAAGFVFHAVALHWVYQTCRFAAVPVSGALLAWGALAAVLALSWALAAGVLSWFFSASPRVLRPFLAALVWTGVAAAAGFWTPRLAVDLPAYTQWPSLALLQCGSWGGPHLLGFAVVLVNAALAEAWLDASSGAARPSAAPLACALAAVGALWAHGAWVLLARPADPGPSLRVEILQPNVDQYRKWDPAFVREILDGYDELLARPRPGPPALVVWPETALPRWTPRREAAPEAARWARALGAAQLVGVLAAPEPGAGAANGVQRVAPDGRAAGFYAKRELVPFGEYVPWRGLAPRFVVERWLRVLDQMGDMTPGSPVQPLLETPLGPAAVTICYEAMFPRWARRDAARGARLLVNVTNDGWYKDTWGPQQHFRANIFRAVENRIPVLRSGNTGVSAAIDPWGVVTAMLPLGARGRLDTEIPLEDPFPERSFYARHGDWFGMTCLALLALAALIRIRAQA